jgi:DNA-binding response OmpR family regulator
MKKKILIIDDDKEFLEELAELLKLNDYEVVAVNDAPLAVDAARKSKPDLVLLDLKMPQESGFQVACKIKFFSQLQDVPIIAMTAYFQDNYADLLRTYGIKHCLTKPFDTVELVSRIEDSLARRPNAAP